MDNGEIMYKEIAKEKFNKLKTKENVLVLAIESSCDETSIAVIKNGREILSNVISSQIDIHKRFGGVVPEVASRNHLLAISNVLNEALEKANITLKDIDAIAVTYGAGLVGALMVGVTFAKSLAYALNLPLIKVNHIKAHISANYLAYNDLKPPFIALIVSGGHTAIVRVDDYVNNTLIGTTHDDAIGECYDKVAKVLGLGYPGGPEIDKRAKLGNNSIKFVKPTALGKGAYGFSYSGLKTAVINFVHKLNQNGDNLEVNDICSSFQCYAVDELVKKSLKACKEFGLNKLAIAGGVSANSYLRETLLKEGKKAKVDIYLPPFILCTDNAAMVGAEAYYQIKSGEGLADLDLTADPSINLKLTKA